AMRVFSISLSQTQPSGPNTLLNSASELSSFWFYQKSSVGQFMSSFSKTVTERTPQKERETRSVQENNYTAHVSSRGGSDQLAGELPSAVIITDQEYPAQAALSVLAKVLDEF
ncbi:Longin-like domain-containing protein, partial [Mycena rosella]